MTTFRRRSFVLLLSLPLLLFLSACTGGDGNGADDSQAGAKDPESAVQGLLDAIAADDPDAGLHFIDPQYDVIEVGAARFIQLGGDSGTIAFEDVRFETEYDEERQHASVVIDMTVVTDTGEVDLADELMVTALIDGRWYVTSPNSEYWRTQLRPSPADWRRVQADADPSLPGLYIAPHPGPDGIAGNADDRSHVPNETVIPICTSEQATANNASNPLCYTSNPPTSGPHPPSAAPSRVYTQPVAREYLLHSMEHGNVVIWYNTANQTVIQALTAMVETYLARGFLVVLAPYPDMEAETVALTAWTRIDKFPATQLTLSRVEDFVAVHERRFNPEDF